MSETPQEKSLSRSPPKHNFDLLNEKKKIDQWTRQTGRKNEKRYLMFDK